MPFEIAAKPLLTGKLLTTSRDFKMRYCFKFHLKGASELPKVNVKDSDRVNFDDKKFKSSYLIQYLI